MKLIIDFATAFPLAFLVIILIELFFLFFLTQNLLKLNSQKSTIEKDLNNLGDKIRKLESRVLLLEKNFEKLKKHCGEFSTFIKRTETKLERIGRYFKNKDKMDSGFFD